MDRSKIVVIALVGVIAAGTAAWSWINFYQTPDYDPEHAQTLVGYFHIRCEPEHSEEVCKQVIGHHHRDCFTEHASDTAADDEIRRAYLRCMDQALEQQLSRQRR